MAGLLPAWCDDYTNQPAWNSTNDIPDATRNVTLPGGRRWSDWADSRMDWTPDSSTWYVNGQLVSRITFQTPRDPAQVMFNTWSDGGSWSGDMQVGTEAYLQIRWIEIVHNNTDPGPVKQGGCKNVCSIDETTKVGTPALISGGGYLYTCVANRGSHKPGRRLTLNDALAGLAGSLRTLELVALSEGHYLTRGRERPRKPEHHRLWCIPELTKLESLTLDYRGMFGTLGILDFDDVYEWGTASDWK
ncbi:hypothetical protein VTI74DRAFT_8181 [Chaetomium olivicolor]